MLCEAKVGYVVLELLYSYRPRELVGRKWESKWSDARDISKEKSSESTTLTW